MSKNTDAVPAGVAALYADIIAHPAEEWKASGSELPYLEWVEGMKAGKIYRVRVFVSEQAEGKGVVIAPVPVVVKEFGTKAAAQKFIKELEDFA